jgi:ADP-dependent phosphofructokinase/glucokinase
MRWFYTLLVLCLATLFFTNPDMRDFKEYIKEESRRMIQENVSAPGLAEALSGAGSELAQAFVDYATTRKDYYLFSTYAIDLTPTNRSDKPLKFVGVGGSFINVRKFDAKQK